VVKSIIIPNTFYNITSSNNTIYWTENKTDLSTTIPSGAYTITDLISAVETAMDSESSGYNTYTGAYSNSNFKITLTADNAFNFTFGTNTANSIGDVLGFTADSASATSNTGDSVADISNPLSRR
jgi:hypothetical protein